MTFTPMMLFPVLLCLLLVGAAIQDARSFTISNRWIIAIILLFVPYAWMAGIGLGAGWHLLHFVLALAVGMLLFALRWFGGGDAKLYAALALWFPVEGGLRLLVSVSIAGFFVVFIFLALARFRKTGDKSEPMRKRRIPYGVAITAGGIMVIINTLLLPAG